MSNPGSNKKGGKQPDAAQPAKPNPNQDSSESSRSSPSSLEEFADPPGRKEAVANFMDDEQLHKRLAQLLRTYQMTDVEFCK